MTYYTYHITVTFDEHHHVSYHWRELFVHMLLLLDNKGNPIAPLTVSFLGVSTNNWWSLSTKGVSMSWCHYKNIERRTAHTIVSWPNPKQWQMVHTSNYANPVYGIATICHQVRWLRWGHSSLFHTATSLLIWYKMFCMRDISYRLTWMEFINMFSVYAQSGTHSHFDWWIIVVLTYNPSVLMCVEITNAPKL